MEGDKPQEAGGGWEEKMIYQGTWGRGNTLLGRGGVRGGVLSHAERAERRWVPVTATILGFCLIPWAGRALRPTPKSQGVDCYSIS